MADDEYEHHEYVEEEDGEDLEQEVYNIQTSVDAMIELLIEKKVFTESEFERKYDELCESEDDSDDDSEEGDSSEGDSQE